MFEAMKKWVNHIADITEKPNLWFGGFQYGDWLELSAKDGEFKGDTRDNLVACAFYANSVNIVCKVGKKNRTLDCARFSKIVNKVLRFFVGNADCGEHYGEFAIGISYLGLARNLCGKLGMWQA